MVKLEVKDGVLHVHGNLFIPGAMNLVNWIQDKGTKVWLTGKEYDFEKETVEINADFLLSFKEIFVSGRIFVSACQEYGCTKWEDSVIEGFNPCFDEKVRFVATINNKTRSGGISWGSRSTVTAKDIVALNKI